MLNKPTVENYLKSLGPYIQELAQTPAVHSTSLVDFKTESMLRGYKVLDIEVDPLIIHTWIGLELYEVSVESPLPDALHLELKKCTHVRQTKEEET